MKKRGLLDSFNYAIEGLVHAIRTQRNMKIHVVTSIGVLLASLSFSISKVETIILCLTITMVIAAELINTAIESAVDATTNYYHPLVKVAKNTAAAAVLITAINAIIVGTLIFWRPITKMTYTGITVVKQSSPYLIAAILGIICLIVLFIKAQVGEGTPLRGGMPSGHTAVAFGMATMISYVSGNPIIITLSFILAVIVAQSRVDSRVHTFWEVLAGALIGLLTTVLIFKIFGY